MRRQCLRFALYWILAVRGGQGITSACALMQDEGRSRRTVRLQAVRHHHRLVVRKAHSAQHDGAPRTHRNHCGIGLFWRAALASFCLVRKVFWEGCAGGEVLVECLEC